MKPEGVVWNLEVCRLRYFLGAILGFPVDNRAPRKLLVIAFGAVVVGSNLVMENVQSCMGTCASQPLTDYMDGIGEIRVSIMVWEMRRNSDLYTSIYAVGSTLSLLPSACLVHEMVYSD